MAATLSAVQWVTIIWFALALPAAMIQHFGFLAFLRRSGAKPRFVHSNNPIYLRRVYRRWCAETGREPDALRLKIGMYLQINLLVAGLAFWIAMSSR